MKKHIQRCACAWTVATLAACGGGSDDGPPPPASTPVASSAAIDKYLGSWSTGCELLRVPGADPTAPNGLSEIEVVAFTKVSDAELSGAGIETQYGSTDCSGPVRSVTNYTLSVAITGTVTIASEVVDKLLIEQAADLDKTIASVRGDRVYFGASTPRDADGYPTTIDTSRFLLKQ